MSNPFNGTWKIDLAESFVWDPTLGRHVPDTVGDEVITLKIENGVQEYEVLYGDSPKLRMGYTAKYDDPNWVEYTVREIIAKSGDVAGEIAAFKQRIKADEGEGARQMELGKAYGYVRLVYIDERTHYRITKNPLPGKSPNVFARRLSEDGKSYLTQMLTLDGVIFRIRKFVKT